MINSGPFLPIILQVQEQLSTSYLEEGLILLANGFVNRLTMLKEALQDLEHNGGCLESLLLCFSRAGC